MPRHSGDADAKSILRAQAVLEQNFGLKLLIRRWLHHLLVDDRDVPARQVLSRHRQLARRKQPAAPFLRRYTQRPEGVPQVADRVTLRKLLLIDVGDASHAERRKNFFAQKFEQRLAGGL